jgi:hypothetical protein
MVLVAWLRAFNSNIWSRSWVYDSERNITPASYVILTMYTPIRMAGVSSKIEQEVPRSLARTPPLSTAGNESNRAVEEGSRQHSLQAGARLSYQLSISFGLRPRSET